MSFETLAYSLFFLVVGLIFLVGIAAALGQSCSLSILHDVVKVESIEVRALLVSCLYFFCTLASPFTLRPIRDTLAIAGGVKNLPYLWTATLAAMVCFHPSYSTLVA